MKTIDDTATEIIGEVIRHSKKPKETFDAVRMRIHQRDEEHAQALAALVRTLKTREAEYLELQAKYLREGKSIDMLVGKVEGLRVAYGILLIAAEGVSPEAGDVVVEEIKK